MILILWWNPDWYILWSSMTISVTPIPSSLPTVIYVYDSYITHFLSGIHRWLLFLFFPPNGWKLEGMRTQCHHSWLDDAFKRTGFLCEVQRASHRAKRWIFLSLKWQNWVIKRVGYGDLPVLQHFAISYTVKTTVFMCGTVTKRSQMWLFKLLMAFRIRGEKKELETSIFSFQQ